MTTKSLTTKEPLSFREALGILVDINVSHDEWGDLPFTALVKPPAGKKSFPEPEMIVKMITGQSVEVLVNNITRNDRRDRLARHDGKPKKGSWGTIQRRGLLTGKIQYRLDNYTTDHYFRQALAAIREPGWKAPEGTRGPLPLFDRIKTAAAVLTGFILGKSWVDLRRSLHDAGIDLRNARGKRKESSPVPSIPVLHKTFLNIPDQVLEAVCRQLSDRCAAAWEAITDTPAPLEYVVDGSTQPTNFEEPFMYGERMTHRLVSLQLTLVTRNIPHTVERLLIPGEKGLSDRDIRPVLRSMPRGSVLLGDSLYDVGYVQKAAFESNVKLMANPRHYFDKEPCDKYRRQAHREFDAKRYRRRKLGERIFGILVKRGILIRKRMTSKTIWKGLRWALVAHNLLALIKLDVKKGIFKTVPAVHGTYRS